jgi:putative nucleotidyltransferase with HDIG domain
MVFLKSIRHHISTAIDQACSFSAKRRQNDLVVALEDTAAALTSTLDFELLLDRILTNVKKVVPHEAINIMLIEGDLVRVVRRQGDEEYIGEAATLNRKMPVSQTPSLIHMLKSGQPEIVFDTHEHPNWVDLPESRWVRSYLAAPIRNKGQVIGFLNLNSNTPNFFTLAQAEHLLAFADQCGIAIENSRLFNSLQKANADLLASYNATLEGWVHALDLRDKEVEGHSQRVTKLTVRLAEALGLHKDQLLHIRHGALLHDIGKIGISDTILHKNGPLNPQEKAIMRQHPVFGFEMLSAIKFLQPAIDIPYCHHERWDGSGYPRGLRGEEIPLPARIFAIVDVWDALVSDRPYRKAMPPADVIAYLRENTGTHFDPNLIEPFINLPEIQLALQQG